ncbi:hypothetical protein SAMN05216276_11523 [Streptosporangium subroseum]|uniref:Uncharacterized protein n=1 Tax=Streptosporangium subroseum TaxID=106412 RepID=A0A239PDL1_9ACTN|nr:hypothetical protein SAMN05216276_11523 [Streptosporangium subroseum]
MTGDLFPQATMLATYLCVTPSQPGVQHIGTASHVKNDDHLPLAPLSVPMLLKPRGVTGIGIEVVGMHAP